jgi:hypothetical protein
LDKKEFNIPDDILDADLLSYKNLSGYNGKIPKPEITKKQIADSNIYFNRQLLIYRKSEMVDQKYL